MCDYNSFRFQRFRSKNEDSVPNQFTTTFMQYTSNGVQFDGLQKRSASKSSQSSENRLSVDS